MKKMRNHLLTFVFISIILSSFHSLNAQLYRETASLHDQIYSIIDKIPGSGGNNLTYPDFEQREIWKKMISNMLKRKYTSASYKANELGYELVRFLDSDNNGKKYYVLRSKGVNYWGTYIYYPKSTRSLVIQAPHPKYDLNTGKESFYVFKNTDAMFLCIAGVHRCNVDTNSSCDGTSTACGSNSFKLSDVSHTTSSIFQATTQELFDKLSDSYFIQLHGFTMNATDPFVVLSNGTTYYPTGADKLVEFKNQLANEDKQLTFKVAHLDLDYTRKLKATTNSQGRYINNPGESSCFEYAPSANGRFFSVEQEYGRLRQNELGWEKVSEALKNTFSLNTTNSKSIHEIQSDEFSSLVKVTEIVLYPNPTQDVINVSGSDINFNEINIYTLEGKNVTNRVSMVYLNDQPLKIEVKSLENGIYIFEYNGEVRLFSKN